MNSLSVLLIACPCALGLATPLTLWHALGRAARAGVIARSTAVIERLGSIQRVYFDKTGTLTQLPMQLEKIGLTNGEVAEIRFESHGWANADRLLQDFIIRTASLEALSEHPFAASLKQWAETAPFELIPVKDFRAVAGAGVEGTIDGLPTWVGSARLMATSHLKIPDKLTQLTKEWQRRGMAVIYAGWEGQVQGILGFAEAVKPEAEQAIAELISMGIKTAVLTGDNQAAGQRWSEMLGIPVEGGLLPEEKLARLKRNGDTVAMVGDGINDGPALAAAPVGIAINQGSDVAQAAAEVVLMRDNLRTVPWLLGLGRETLRKIRQNLAWAFFYNILGIALAMTGHLQPVLAALAMVLSSLIVTTNALRLSRFPGLDGEPDLLSDDLDEPIYPYALEEPV